MQLNGTEDEEEKEAQGGHDEGEEEKVGGQEMLNEFLCE